MGEIQYIAGIYMRLSNDDERAGESASIENQRILLTKHAEEQGWEIKDYYIDDGWSGTNFDRPAFQRMMLDAKNKRINLVMVKDMSRLGRNHIEVGRLTDDVFPSLGVRFVAVNDRVDSLLGDDDMTAYRNLFNEFLSKDTSRKVRSVKRSCMERGKYIGTYAPLGYKKDFADKHSLVIDEETAHIVRRIFEMRCKGHGYRSIAISLNKDKIPSPRDIHFRRVGKQMSSKINGVWGDSSVAAILKNEAYIGNTVQGRYTTTSYKNRKIISKPEEQWIRVENTHEPLITLEQWNTVQALSAKKYKPRKTSDGEQNIFAGILKCGDCGFAMRANIEKGKRKNGSAYRYVSFICCNYSRSGKAACTVHTISETALTELILTDICEKAKMAIYDEQRVADAVIQAKSREKTACLAIYKRELKAADDRLIELDNIIKTLYEDRVRGIISDAMFKNLSQKYEEERKDKTSAVTILRDKIKKGEMEWCDVDSWMGIIRKYSTLESLTQDILFELIDRIEVYEAERVGGRRICRVRIRYLIVDDVSESLALMERGDECG